jgi:hypothetical protein
MNFYDIIESFAAKASSKSSSESSSTAKKSKTIKSTISESKPDVSSSLMSGEQNLTTVATVTGGSIVLDNIVDELIDEKGLLNGRRSGENIEHFQQLNQRQTLPPAPALASASASAPVPAPALASATASASAPAPASAPSTPSAHCAPCAAPAAAPAAAPVTTTATSTTATDQVKDNCDRVEDMGLEFRKPYLFMLKPTNDIMNNNEYNYRLICNVFLNNDNLNKDNKRYLYIFGLFPCKYIPSAYIPLNRKKLLENTKRLEENKSDIIKNIFRDEVQFNKHFQNKIKQFMNKNTIYNNLNLSVFGIILILYWSLVLLFLNYLMLYYFRSSFNNILAGILLILLLFSIIWKMIYTVQN